MDAIEHYSGYFNALEERSGVEPSWLSQRRKESFASFEELGFPTRKLEEWKYTAVKRLAETPFAIAGSNASELSRDDIAEHLLRDSLQLVFVNGCFAPELSSFDSAPEGLELGSLREAIQDQPARIEPYLGKILDSNLNGFTALNAALHQDGAFVHVAKGIELESPVQILHLVTADAGPVLAVPRNLYLAEPESKLTVLESFASLGQGLSLTNAASEISVGRGAKVELLKLQNQEAAAAHISATQAHQEESSSFNSISLTIGGELTRNDLRSLLDAEGAECVMKGLYAARKKQVVDNHTVIDHAKPHCTSSEYYKGILDDQARGVFNGRVIVQRDAQKIESNQSNKNLLLSDAAEIDSKPELIIYADDVKCAHGSTTGAIDEDALFYLRSRGISETDARGMLTRAFASEITEQISIDALRDHVDDLLLAYFDAEAA